MSQPLPESVLERAMLILRAFGPDDRAISLSNLVRRTGLAKTTVHRLTGQMVRLRLLDRDASGALRLGRGLFELGMRASVEQQLIEVAMPFMQDLYTRSLETVHLGVREGYEVVYVSKIGGHRQTRTPSRIGGRMPLHCTAIGKALLAFSDDELIVEVLSDRLERRTARTISAPGILKAHLHGVLQDGVAYEHEESAAGIMCVASPVLDRDDRPVAAISITGPVNRFTPEQHAPPVRAAAAGIGAALARRDALTETDTR